MTIDYKALANQAAETEDQTETTSFEFSLPPEGPGVARFVEYIECGTQPRKTFGTKEKKPAPYVLLTFDLLSPKNIRQGEGEQAGRTFCDRMTIRLSKLLDGKAGYKKLFNTMARGRETVKHMAQMLNECFGVKVVYSKSKDGTKTYANLRDENCTWFINAPVVVDALAGTQQDISGSIPPAIGPIKIFLWDKPTKETWDTLFIDGTRTKKNADGTEEEVSKNWIQSLIVAATDFQGSPLEALLGGVPDLPLSEEPGQEPAEEPQDAPAPEPEEDDEEAALLKQLAAAKAKKAAKGAAPAPAAPPAPAKVDGRSKAAKEAKAAQEPKKAPAAAPAKAPAKAPAPAKADKPAQPSAADALKALGLG